MLVSDAVAAVLADFGADTVFGVVGSGNFHVTNGLTARGARFVAARHECGAASMADGWARISGRPGIVSVHQGPGLTNAMTGITEAAVKFPGVEMNEVSSAVPCVVGGPKFPAT